MNHGSLSLRGGVLHVARHVRRAYVQPFDLDGRALGPGLAFAGRDGAALALGGIDVDSDRQIWAVDGAAGAVRAFSLFGREGAGFAGAPAEHDDARGVLVGATDLALHETDDALSVLVARGSVRRHALALLRTDGRLVESLRPLGDPLERFEGVLPRADQVDEVVVAGQPADHADRAVSSAARRHASPRPSTSPRQCRVRSTSRSTLAFTSCTIRWA